MVAAGSGILAAAIVALAVMASRLRERVARLEEWQRIHETWETDDPGGIEATFPRG
jgi:hypothetical protein